MDIIKLDTMKTSLKLFFILDELVTKWCKPNDLGVNCSVIVKSARYSFLVLIKISNYSKINPKRGLKIDVSCNDIIG